MNAKRIISLVLSVFFALSVTVVFSMKAAAEEVSVTVESVKGTVTFKRAASEKTASAFKGLKLKQGDVVTTGKGGEVVISIGNDKTIKALSESSFKISTLSGTDDDSKVGFTLIKGTVYNEVRTKNSTDETLKIQTGNTVVGVRGTTFSVNMRGRDGTTVHTLEGTVFLENVIKRIMESGDNASLVREQTEVGAGQGGGLSGVYELDINDLLPEELEFIVNNPELFGDGFAEDAAALLNELINAGPAPGEDEDEEIVYLPDSQPQTGGGGGDYSDPAPPPAANTYTVTFVNDAANGHLNYYGKAMTITVPAGSTLDDYDDNNGGAIEGSCPVKLGYYFDGWYDDPTSPTAVEYYFTSTQISPVPINGNLTLYPRFTEDSNMWGNGTSGKPFVITANNFPHFRYYVHTDTPLSPDYTIRGLSAYYKLADNINCNLYTSGNMLGWTWDWTPIGTASAPFLGSFNGSGYTISNFKINITSGAAYAGFFGKLDSAANVQRLAFEYSEVKLTGSSGSVYAGIIAGESTGNAVIQNCAVINCTVSLSGSAGYASAGGIVGALTSGSTATVENCVFIGTVSALLTATDIYAGGISGQNAGTISRSVAYSGSVTVSSGGQIGRITGNSTGALNFNYASDTFLPYAPADPTSKDGGTVNSTDMIESWWSSPLNWDFSTSGAWEWPAGTTGAGVPLLKQD